MSRFAAELFAESPVLLLPIIGLLLFATVFLVVCVWAIRLSAAEVRDYSHLPLDEEEHHG